MHLDLPPIPILWIHSRRQHLEGFWTNLLFRSWKPKELLWWCQITPKFPHKHHNTAPQPSSDYSSPLQSTTCLCAYLQRTFFICMEAPALVLMQLKAAKEQGQGVVSVIGFWIHVSSTEASLRCYPSMRQVSNLISAIH